MLPIRGVRDARLSPSGDSVAIAAGDRVARIWSTEGVPVLEFRTARPRGRRRVQPRRAEAGHRRAEGRDALEPSRERTLRAPDRHRAGHGRPLVQSGRNAAGHRRGRRSWADLERRHGPARAEPLRAHGSTHVGRVQPGGKLVVTASADHDAIVWDADTGEQREGSSGARGGRERCWFQLRRTLDRDRRAGQGRPVGSSDRRLCSRCWTAISVPSGARSSASRATPFSRRATTGRSGPIRARSAPRCPSCSPSPTGASPSPTGGRR